MRLYEWNSPDYQYVCCCADGGHGNMGEAIHDMTDREQEISYRDFVKLVGVDQLADIFSVYDWNPRGKGLKMKDDYTMTSDAFFRSTWFGIDCVFCVQSGIEYIFTRDGKTPESERINRTEYLMSLHDED